MQGDVSTFTLCLSRRVPSKHVMFTTEDDFRLFATVLSDLRLGLDRWKLLAKLINTLLASMGEGEGRRAIDPSNKHRGLCGCRHTPYSVAPSRGALQLPRDD